MSDTPQPVSAVQRITPSEYGMLARQAAVLMSGGEVDEQVTSTIFNLLRISNRLVRDFEVAVYESGGLSWSAYQLLYTLKSVGPLHPKTLARIAAVSTASMSSLLNTMSKKGLIDRSPDPEDGRRQIISLSAEGDAMVQRLYRENLAREKAWSTALAPAEFEALNSLVQKMLDHRPAAVHHGVNMI